MTFNQAPDQAPDQASEHPQPAQLSDQYLEQPPEQYTEQTYPAAGAYEQPPAYQQAPGDDQAYAYQAQQPPQPDSYGAYPPPALRPTSLMAIASLVLSVLGVVPLLGFITAILGVIFGHMALNEVKRSNGAVEGQGLALAGLVVGYLVIGLYALACCGFLALGLALPHPVFSHP